MTDKSKPSAVRDEREFFCAKCGKDMDTSLVGLPNDEGARVFWHRDGTPDNCEPQPKVSAVKMNLGRNQAINPKYGRNEPVEHAELPDGHWAKVASDSDECEKAYSDYVSNHFKGSNVYVGPSHLNKVDFVAGWTAALKFKSEQEFDEAAARDGCFEDRDDVLDSSRVKTFIKGARWQFNQSAKETKLDEVAANASELKSLNDDLNQNVLWLHNAEKEKSALEDNRQQLLSYIETQDEKLRSLEAELRVHFRDKQALERRLRNLDEKLTAEKSELEVKVAGLVDALQQIAGLHDTYQCDDKLDCEYTAGNALAQFNQSKGGRDE